MATLPKWEILETAEETIRSLELLIPDLAEYSGLPAATIKAQLIALADAKTPWVIRQQLAGQIEAQRVVP